MRFFGSCRVREDCSIGQFTFISDKTTLFPKTSVGRYCSIGKSCEVGAPTHPDGWVTSSPVAFSIDRHFPDEAHIFTQNAFQQYKPTTIGSDVWIGSLSMVFAGINIGHGAIVGGGSVVTSDVPPYAIVVGSAAKILRYRFDNETIRRLLAVQWWSLSPENVGDLDLKDVSATLNYLEKQRAREAPH